jgi:hypothetical protein
VQLHNKSQGEFRYTIADKFGWDVCHSWSEPDPVRLTTSCEAFEIASNDSRPHKSQTAGDVFLSSFLRHAPPEIFMFLAERLHADRSLNWVAALTLLVLISPHWLLTRDFADGAVVSFARQLGNTDGLFIWLRDSNWLLAIAFYKVVFAISDLSGVGYLVLTKCALSMLLVVLYLECALWARDVFKLPPDQASLAALLCLASPSLYTLANSTATVNLLCICLVFVGHRLYWADRVSVRLIGLTLLVMSFQVNSNLVFALALEVVRLWRSKPHIKQRWIWFLGLILAAVFVYFSIRVLSPPQQLFAQYNQLLNPLDHHDFLRIGRVVMMFLTWGIIPLAALVAVAIVSFFLRNRSLDSSWGKVSTQDGLISLLALVFLAGAAAFPYVVVGKGPPLFTPTAYGSGLTEQVFRAAYSGPIAPTWANTSMRHGFLFSIPIGLMTWIAAAMMMQKLKLRWSPTGLFAILLPLALVWVLPAYSNKLQNQWAEMSLVKGFQVLPPAKPGIVELRYQPVSSWLIWTSSANLILREAWGSSGYLGFFHSLDVYRDDLYWQYHTYFLSKGVLQTPLLQNAAAMQEFPGADCLTKYQGDWPSPTFLQIVLAGWLPETVPAASIRQVVSSCEPGRLLPNPTPDKKVIY